MELFNFLQDQQVQRIISEFCSVQNIQWKYIAEHAPHFGGIWEAAVKSIKIHLRKIVGEAKLNFEELTTVIAQVEACLNSRPLTPLPDSDDGIEALTQVHFLVGCLLEALPDPSSSYQHPSLLCRWHLCQLLVQQYWNRWSSEY